MIDNLPIEKTKTCWFWRGGVTKSGYGTFRRTTAHRFVYKLLKGEIPSGYELDHTCRNRTCVFPGHLDVVTHSENQRRAWARGSFANRKLKIKTHCVHGHKYTKENTYIQSGFRTCRQCHKIREFNRRHK